MLSLTVCLLACWSTVGFAEENRLKEVLTNSLYGSLVGALVGAAVLAFAKRPGNHLEFMAYGASAGAVGGTTYTLVKPAKPLAELENGKITLGIPTIIPDIRDTNSKGETPVVVVAEFFAGDF